MKVTPVAGNPASRPQAPSQSAQSARERAISMLTNQAPPVEGNIDPEEQAAVMPVRAIANGDSDENGYRHQEEPQHETPNNAPEATEEAPATPPKVDALSKQYAALAKREQQLRAYAKQQEQKWQQREAELKALEAKYSQQPDTSGYIPKDQLQSNTIQALIQAGVPIDQFYNQLTDHVLNGQPVNPQVQANIDALQNEIKALRAEREEEKKNSQNQQTQAYEAAKRQITNTVQTLVKTDDSFETIRNTNSYSDVVELIEKTFHEDGVLLSEEEACQLVEDELTERIYKVASNTKKLKERFQPKVAPKVETKQTAVPPQQQTQASMKTLTNANSAPARQLNARERAIAAFKGQLK